MRCPNCGHESPDDANFCKSCGRFLGMNCPKCGGEMEPGFLRTPVDLLLPSWYASGGGKERVGQGGMWRDFSGYRCAQCGTMLIS